MKGIRRLYVEKKKGYDVEARHVLLDIQESLGVKSLKQLRIVNRYDVEGISEGDYETAKKTIFSEPPVDYVYEETAPMQKDEVCFAVEFLPGQYDQRADSAMQCIQLISQSEKPVVCVAKVFILSGSLSEEEIKRIKDYCINPVDSREASLEKPESLEMVLHAPQECGSLEGFTAKTKEEVQALVNEIGTAMSLEDMLFCQQYFKDAEKRNPTMTELRVIDTYWSDHCRHTTFQTELRQIVFEEGCYKPAFEAAYQSYLSERAFVYGESTDRKITLMDIAVLGMKSLKKKGVLDNLDESEEINACSIVVPVEIDGKTEEWLVMFKNETHNHPTEIEPFGGAATCLGGAIRDPLSGRAYVYQAMRVTGAGDPTVPVSQTLKGKLPQKKIVTEAARGYSSYGNQIGLATGQVTEIYDEGFLAKHMEVGAVIAAAKKEHVVRKIPAPGDSILLVGGRTGRDGCGGATGSSKEHTVASIETCGAEVQKGNAPTERKLQRLFRNPAVSKMIKRCNDFGAGGVSVAIGELADGLVISLDAVPKKYEGMDGTELAISESQERMAVVVAKEDADAFIRYAAEENLEATKVAEVTEEKRLQMCWRGKKIVDISREFLDTNGVRQVTEVQVSSPVKDGFFEREETQAGIDNKQRWLSHLSDFNIASQKGLSERFDSTIGSGTVLMPFGGRNQLTPPQAMAAKVPVLEGETSTVTLMSFGYTPALSKWSPFHGAVYAVVESLARIVATGGGYEACRLTFQEYFEKLGKDPQKWGRPFAALIGAFFAQMQLKTAAIGGKDSMSGTFMDRTVPPTLISFAVGVSSADKVLSPEFKKSENMVVFLPMKRDKYDLPDFSYVIRMFQLVNGYIEKGICSSAYAVGAGGVAEAVTKMAVGNGIGLRIGEDISLDSLFEPAIGSFVLELADVKVIDFQGLDAVILGETIEEACIFAGGLELPLAEAIDAWEKPLSKVYPAKTEDSPQETPEIPVYEGTCRSYQGHAFAKPRVFIPVFPGSNCEYDSARAFERAGALAVTQVISNLSVQALEESIQKMADAIRQSQMILLPGGFSAGDEPDGSGKFIAAAFRSPAVQEAVMDLLKNRDGLILGICNGFQALIKLGLVPYGEIRELQEDSPTLTYNAIGRHVSCLVHTKIVSDKSPWLWEVKPGDIHTIPVSHGEGRFIAPPAVLNDLIARGQIATQYVDADGVPSMNMPYNPNGSMFAVEGIMSPDGRVLGKMGHSERIGRYLYKNVPGEQDQKLFLSGVRYFK